MKTLADWARLLREQPEARKFSDEQIPAWTRIAARVGEKERILAISHGGIIDMPAVLLMETLRVKIEGASFGYGEGVRLTYAKGRPAAIEVLRA
jgi:broad specificity phosphatase PhoE